MYTKIHSSGVVTVVEILEKNHWKNQTTRFLVFTLRISIQKDKPTSPLGAYYSLVFSRLSIDTAGRRCRQAAGCR